MSDLLESSSKNQILRDLPKEDITRLLPDLEEISFGLGQMIYLTDEPIKYVYFSINSMVSVISSTLEGQNVEVGVIGREGIIGFDVLMGVDASSHDNLVQISDSALRISTTAIKKEFKRGGAFQNLTLLFMRKFLLQVSQTAVCNRLHHIEKRLARWLLMSHDRSPSDTLLMTQEFLSMMLGVNRVTVTLASLTLQNAEFIKNTRGQITIINRQGLEEFACECYKIVKNIYNR